METLEFPPIAEPETKPVTATAVATVQSAALAPFVAIEAGLRILAERYRAVVFDPSTPAGLETMRKARQELREHGRFAVQRALDGTKRILNDTKGEIEEKAKALIAINRPREDEIHEVIEAREAAIAAAKKAEAERLAKIEAERVAKHDANIATIRGYVAQAAGRTSAQIEAGLTALSSIVIGDSWEEFRDRAKTALDQARHALREMSDAAFTAEKEAAEREAQRKEQARVAAEQAAEAKRLQEARDLIVKEDAIVAGLRANAARIEFDSSTYIQKAINTFESAAPDWENDPRPRVAHTVAECRAQMAAKLATAKEREALAAEKAAWLAAQEAAKPPPAAPVAVEPIPEALASQHVLKAEGETPDATDRDAPATASPVGGPMGGGQPAAAGPLGEIDTRPPINVGEIARRLGFNLPSAFIVETLGVPTVEIAGRKGVYWMAAQWPAIKTALIAHVTNLA